MDLTKLSVRRSIIASTGYLNQPNATYNPLRCLAGSTSFGYFPGNHIELDLCSALHHRSKTTIADSESEDDTEFTNPVNQMETHSNTGLQSIQSAVNTLSNDSESKSTKLNEALSQFELQRKPV